MWLLSGSNRFHMLEPLHVNHVFHLRNKLQVSREDNAGLLIGQSLHDFDPGWNILTTIRGIVTRFGADIRAAQGLLL